jgi:hypothetical protein
MGRAELGGRPVIPEVIEVEPNRFRAEGHLFYEGLISDPTQGGERWRCGRCSYERGATSCPPST